MTTRDGHKWLVLRSETGGSYVAARSDSDFARKHRKNGTYAGSFKTMEKALERAKELNWPILPV
jgi:hypothetical protein